MSESLRFVPAAATPFQSDSQRIVRRQAEPSHIDLIRGSCCVGALHWLGLEDRSLLSSGSGFLRQLTTGSS